MTRDYSPWEKALVTVQLGSNTYRFAVTQELIRSSKDPERLLGIQLVKAIQDCAEDKTK